MRRSIANGWLGSVLAFLLVACGGGGSGSAQLSFSPNSAPPPTGTTGVAYPTFTFVAPTGGLGPFTWTENGALPQGMSLSPNGRLSGTPLTAGTFSFTLTVTDSSSPNQAAKESVTLLIKDAPLVIDATRTPPNAALAQPYGGFAFTAKGGSAPLSWRVTAGALPSGLTLNTNGELSGMPVNAGTTTFTVTVRDSSATPQTSSRAFTIVIFPLPTLTLNPSLVVIRLGRSVNLTWTSSNTTSYCSGTYGLRGSALLPAGTRSVTPPTLGVFSYGVACTGPGGSVDALAQVVVESADASLFSVEALVANVAPRVGGPITVDPNLVNPWGIAFAPGSAVSVANNGTSTSSQYDGNGIPQPVGSPLVIRFPTGTGGAAFRPTGVVANSTADFVIGSGASSGAAQLIYAGQSGMIAAWAPSVSAAAAVTTYTDTGGAVYTGLALANNGGANFLYAADFHGGKIDVFDGGFRKQAPSAAHFSFSDPSLPVGYAPFGIHAINNAPGGGTQLYVTYAQPQGTNGMPKAGPGSGAVDIFDTNGSLIRQWIVGGYLDAPWGVALAPPDFGSRGELLLVSNFGNGFILTFDPATGQLQGLPLDTGGWLGLAFGNDVGNQSHFSVFCTQGPLAPSPINGLLGRIDLVRLPHTIENVTIAPCTNPILCSLGTSTITAYFSNDSPTPIAAVQYFINGRLYETCYAGDCDSGVVWQDSAAHPIRSITVTMIDVNGLIATRTFNY